MRPTAPGYLIFFQGKRASQQPFQIPCVFSGKTRLGFNVTVNLHVMRPRAPKFRVFCEENVPRRNPAALLTFVVFSQVKCVLGSQVHK